MKLLTISFCLALNFYFPLRTSLIAQKNLWLPLNGPCLSVMEVLTTSPNGTLFMIIDGGILKRSTDNGNLWTIVTPPFMDYGSYPMGIAFDSKGTVYVTSTRALGISSDNGTTWTRTGNPTSVHALRSLLIYQDTAILAVTNNSLYRSNDSGKSWNVMGIYPEMKSMRRIAQTSKGLMYIRNSSDLYTSSNGGDHWMKLATPKKISDFFIDRNDWIFASASASILRSTDYGKTWDVFTKGLDSTLITSLCRSESGQLFALRYQTTYNPTGILFSSDDGMSWNRIRNKYTDHYSIAVTHGKDNSVFVGREYGGVYNTTDDGVSWRDRNRGLSTFVIFGIAAPSPDEIILLGDGKVFRSEDDGESWSEFSMPSGLNRLQFNSFARNADSVSIIGSKIEGLYRSTDHGKHWMHDTLGIGYNTSITSLFYHSNGWFFASTYGKGLFVSSDQGNSWRPVEWDNPQTIVRGVFSLPDGTMLAATGEGLFTSDDNGLRWRQVFNNLSSYQITTLSSNKAGVLLAGTEANGVYISTDSGNQWMPRNTGIENLYLQSSIVLSDNVLFVVTDQGVRKSTDLGLHWERCEEGLTNETVTMIACTKSNKILIGTLKHGGFSRQHDLLNRENVLPRLPQQISLSQNFPNPFLDRTEIHYALPNRGLVRLKIFDVFGREVHSFVNEVREAGEHQVDVFSSLFVRTLGVYFYSLEFEGERIVRKMLVVK